MNPQHRHRADAHTDTQPNLPRIDPSPDGPRHSPPSSGRVGTGFVAPIRQWLQVRGNGRYTRTALVASLVAVIVVALVVAVVSYRSAVNSGEQGSNATGGAAHHVTYKATSTGKTVIVTYTQGDNGLDGQTTAPSPWTINTTTTANVAVLTVTTDNDVRSVSCAIVDTSTGNTLVSKSVPPSTGATVTCVSGSLGT